MNEPETLDEYLEGREPKGFKAIPHYFPDGDFVSYFFSDERCHAKREADLLTVYYSDATNRMVGCKIEGVIAELQRKVSDGCLH